MNAVYPGAVPARRTHFEGVGYLVEHHGPLPYAVQIWARNTLELRGGETIVVHRLDGPPEILIAPTPLW